MVTYSGCTCGNYNEGCVTCGFTYSDCKCDGDYNEGCMTCSKTKQKKLKNYKVRIELNCEWAGYSEKDILNHIDEEYGGFGDIQNDIDIEEINDALSESSEVKKE